MNQHAYGGLGTPSAGVPGNPGGRIALDKVSLSGDPRGLVGRTKSEHSYRSISASTFWKNGSYTYTNNS